MTVPQDHALFDELAVGHALSALEPDEEQAFLRHLDTCPVCPDELQRHQETLSLLALAVEPADPPASVLEGIRAGMAPQGLPAPSSAPSSAPAPSGPAEPPSAPPVQPAAVPSLAEVRSRRRVPGRAVQWVGAAAAAALLLSLGAWNLALRSDRDAAQERTARFAAAVRDLARPGSDRVPLRSPEGAVLAVAVVQDGEVSLVVDGLAPNAGGTTYVLWAQDGGGGVRPVGAFDVEQQVEVVTDLPVEGGGGPVTAYLVSNERGDDAPPTPAGQVLARGTA